LDIVVRAPCSVLRYVGCIHTGNIQIRRTSSFQPQSHACDNIISHAIAQRSSKFRIFGKRRHKRQACAATGILVTIATLNRGIGDADRASQRHSSSLRGSAYRDACCTVSRHTRLNVNGSRGYDPTFRHTGRVARPQDEPRASHGVIVTTLFQVFSDQGHVPTWNRHSDCVTGARS
jgi:hypothetical protein